MVQLLKFQYNYFEKIKKFVKFLELIVFKHSPHDELLVKISGDWHDVQ